MAPLQKVTLKSNIEKLKGEPIKELQTPGFFAMAYPTVFISGSCDITVPKLVKLDLQDWIQHIYYNMDNRVSAHPHFLITFRYIAAIEFTTVA